MRLVSVVIVNWNGAKFLGDCLDSILKQSYPDREILVIDNASQDNSVQMVRERYLPPTSDVPVRLVENSENRGYCGGCNQGIDLAAGAYILILNPDTILSPNFIQNLVSSAELDPHIGMVAGKLLRFDRVTLDTTGQFLRWNLTPLDRGYGQQDTGQFDTPGYSFSTCGAAAFYRREMLEDIKINGEYFDTSFFTYYEDLDLGWRAQLLGWKCYYNPEALAFHYRGGSLNPPEGWESGSRRAWEHLPRFSMLKGIFPRYSFRDKPPFLQKHILKNRYLTLLKNLGALDLILNLPSLLLFESLIWGYACLIQPELLGILPQVFRLLPQTLKKHRIIQSRRVVSASYIKSWVLST